MCFRKRSGKSFGIWRFSIMNQKLMTKDFTLVVLGQIISLFGNAAIRFALPLYLLNVTGSSALYGTVMACAFLPAIALSPIGGIVADRVNKRNIMVILDFFTAFFYFHLNMIIPAMAAAIPIILRNSKGCFSTPNHPISSIT